MNTKYNINGYRIPKGRTEYSERVEDDACLQANNKNLEIKINNSAIFNKFIQESLIFNIIIIEISENIY